MKYRVFQSANSSVATNGTFPLTVWSIGALALLTVSLSSEAKAQQTEGSTPAVAQEITVGSELPYAFFQTPASEGPHPVIIVLGGAEGGDQTAR
ncbi:MAG: hypothetical protein AAGI28_17010, partial [Pseudomonadota bacterium]